MAFYLYQVGYTPEAWATMAKKPQDRIEAVRPAIEKLGGKVVSGYLAFGEYGAAMTALERGIEAREPLLGLPAISCDPLFDPLKPDPRFAPLMQRLGERICTATGKWPIAPRPH